MAVVRYSGSLAVVRGGDAQRQPTVAICDSVGFLEWSKQVSR